jgi:xylulokinase
VVFGGGARSPFWCELLAHVAGMPVQALELVDVAAWGACILAGLGCGLPTAEAALPSRAFTPDPAASRTYDDLYGAYLSAQA